MYILLMFMLIVLGICLAKAIIVLVKFKFLSPGSPSLLLLRSNSDKFG